MRELVVKQQSFGNTSMIPKDSVRTLGDKKGAQIKGPTKGTTFTGQSQQEKGWLACSNGGALIWAGMVGLSLKGNLELVLETLPCTGSRLGQARPGARRPWIVKPHDDDCEGTRGADG